MTSFTAPMTAFQYLITNSWTLWGFQQILWVLSIVTVLRMNVTLRLD